MGKSFRGFTRKKLETDLDFELAQLQAYQKQAKRNLTPAYFRVKQFKETPARVPLYFAVIWVRLAISLPEFCYRDLAQKMTSWL
jgi:hypothetical protein